MGSSSLTRGGTQAPCIWEHGVLVTWPPGESHTLFNFQSVWQAGGGWYSLPLLDVENVLVNQLCPILYDPVGCSPPGSSVHGILQARILEWVAISSSRPRDQTQVSRIAGRHFNLWATREALIVKQVLKLERHRNPGIQNLGFHNTIKCELQTSNQL